MSCPYRCCRSWLAQRCGRGALRVSVQSQMRRLRGHTYPLSHYFPLSHTLETAADSIQHVNTKGDPVLVSGMAVVCLMAHIKVISDI